MAQNTAVQLHSGIQQALGNEIFIKEQCLVNFLGYNVVFLFRDAFTPNKIITLDIILLRVTFCGTWVIPTWLFLVLFYGFVSFSPSYKVNKDRPNAIKITGVHLLYLLLTRV